MPSKVLVASTRFGDLEVDGSDILTLVQPLAGFPQTQRLAAHQAPQQGDFVWLQSLEEPGLAFVAVNPGAWFEGWELGIGEADREALGGEGAGEIRALCLVSFKPQASANVAAPLVFGAANRRALQVLDSHEAYRLDQPLFEAPPCSS